MVVNCSKQWKYNGILEWSNARNESFPRFVCKAQMQELKVKWYFLGLFVVMGEKYIVYAVKIIKYVGFKY